MNEKQKAYYQKNREKILKRQKEYNARHKEEKAMYDHLRNMERWKEKAAYNREYYRRRKEGKGMAKVNVNDFDGGFDKQLAYSNRTFLRGYYNYRSGAEKFAVIRNGKVWEFDNLPDAVNKYNEVIQYGQSEQIPE